MFKRTLIAALPLAFAGVVVFACGVAPVFPGLLSWVVARVPAAERIRGTVIPAGRADVIVAGAAVILAALDHYGLDALTVSNRGVRFGLLFEHARLT